MIPVGCNKYPAVIKIIQLADAEVIMRNFDAFSIHPHIGERTDAFAQFVRQGIRKLVLPVDEPAADLAVLMAIHSSLRNKPLPRGLVVFGEVGLAGEIRPAPRGQDRLREAVKLGFSLAVIPKSNVPKQPFEGLTVIGVERIDEAFDKIREWQDT